jgi:hypothetical protein
MGFVSQFVENAARIFEAAENAALSGQSLSDMTILISQSGGIRMVADSDWPLDSLQAWHGAQMAYRVSQQEGMVRVHGRAGAQTCSFETARPERAVRLLLGSQPQYEVIPAPRLLTA